MLKDGITTTLSQIPSICENTSQSYTNTEKVWTIECDTILIFFHNDKKTTKKFRDSNHLDKGINTNEKILYLYAPILS